MTINPSLIYLDNQTLDTDKHNKNVYTDANGFGIMSEANGGLNNTNLSTTFEVSAEHVQPEQVALRRLESMQRTIDCFDDAFARADSESYTLNQAIAQADTDAKHLWIPIPGAGLRFYQPYNATMALLQWSIFFEAFRVNATDTKDLDSATTAYHEMALGVRYDDSLLKHTVRKIAPSMWHTFSGDSKSVPAEKYMLPPGRACEYWDQAHMVDNTSANGRITKGFHDMQLCIYMERVRAEYFLRYFKVRRNGIALDGTAGTGTSKRYQQFGVHQRCTFGIRNARVVSIL